MNAFTDKTAAIPLIRKVSSNSCFIGCDQLYTGYASGSSRENGLNKLTVAWRSGNEVVSCTPPTQQQPTLKQCSESAPNITHQPAFEIPNTSPRDPTHLYNTFILGSLQTFFTYFNLVKVFSLLYQTFFPSEFSSNCQWSQFLHWSFGIVQWLTVAVYLR